ncbi:MAG: divalent-cation tolerance protein CutA [Verrucomicrobiota bacterium]
MKNDSRFVVALVTAPDLKTARKLARAALAARLAACVNIVPRLESHYWWQGKLERGAELLMVIKTRRAKVAALQKTILANHPYDTAEFIVLPINAGSRKYLDWISASVA